MLHRAGGRAGAAGPVACIESASQRVFVVLCTDIYNGMRPGGRPGHGLKA